MRGVCASCGRTLDRHTSKPHRDKEFEAQLVREMARGLNVDPEPIINLSWARADVGASHYGWDFPAPHRNLEREALEELADCANYVSWRLDGIRRDLYEDDDRTMHLQRALRHVVLAFEECRAAMRSNEPTVPARPYRQNP